ncbi:hypothetical protein GCM10009625_31900 [Brachybacterium fresconis]
MTPMSDTTSSHPSTPTWMRRGVRVLGGAALAAGLSFAGAGMASAVEVNPQFVEVNPQFVEVNPQFVEVNPQFVEVNPQIWGNPQGR